jgi:ribosome-associated protein
MVSFLLGRRTNFSHSALVTQISAEGASKNKVMNPKDLHAELKFRSSRSSGSGGQHVNKVETRVELLFDLEGSVLLSAEQKERIRKALASRITKEGVLAIAASRARSQLLNKSAAIRQFDHLIAQALQPAKKRKPVKPLSSAPEKRLRAKQRQSEKKAARTKAAALTIDG